MERPYSPDFTFSPTLRKSKKYESVRPRYHLLSAKRNAPIVSKEDDNNARVLVETVQQLTKSHIFDEVDGRTVIQRHIEAEESVMEAMLSRMAAEEVDRSEKELSDAKHLDDSVRHHVCDLLRDMDDVWAGFRAMIGADGDQPTLATAPDHADRIERLLVIPQLLADVDRCCDSILEGYDRELAYRALVQKQGGRPAMARQEKPPSQLRSANSFSHYTQRIREYSLGMHGR